MPANKKISDLAEDTSVTLADYIPIVTTGAALTKKASLARVLALADGGSGSGSAAVFLDSFVVNLPDNETGIPNGTQVNAGDPIAPFLEAAFRKASPAQYVQPSVVLSGGPAPANYEIGETVSIDFTINFHQNDAGSMSAISLKRNTATITPTAGIYADSIVISQTPIPYQATVNYNQGPVKNDSLGNADATGQIPAGSVISNTLQYQGFYKLFYDCVATFPTDSATARALSNSRFSNAGNTFTLNTGSTLTRFCIVLPPGKSLVNVIDQDALNLDITAQYLSSSITVNDAAGTAVSYTLYSMSQSVPYSTSHRHNITIA